MSRSGSLPPVFLIDDNVDDLFLLRQRLSRGGIENPIVSFEDGEEAMARLKRLGGEPGGEPPCVIFLDLRMPRCGGFEVLKWVRAQPLLEQVQVVIVTTSTLPEDAVRAKQLGAAGLLSKYPSPETLARLVKDSPVQKARDGRA